MIVLDASAAVAWLLGRPGAQAVELRISDPTRSLHAPHLLAVEVAHALRRIERTTALTPERALATLADLEGLGVERYAHEDLLPQVWQLRHDITAYDAVYVALTSTLDATLVTLDGKLAAAARRHCDVDLIT